MWTIIYAPRSYYICIHEPHWLSVRFQVQYKPMHPYMAWGHIIFPIRLLGWAEMFWVPTMKECHLMGSKKTAFSAVAPHFPWIHICWPSGHWSCKVALLLGKFNMFSWQPGRWCRFFLFLITFVVMFSVILLYCFLYI